MHRGASHHVHIGLASHCGHQLLLQVGMHLCTGRLCRLGRGQRHAHHQKGANCSSSTRHKLRGERSHRGLQLVPRQRCRNLRHEFLLGHSVAPILWMTLREVSDPHQHRCYALTTPHNAVLVAEHQNQR